MKKLSHALLVATTAVASLPVLAESCTDTSFSIAAIECRGSFSGNINGSASELAYLSSQFGGTFSYLGKSDDADSGPFSSNLSGSTQGTLSFDAPLAGTFVIGLKAANQYSYYLFDAATPITSVSFDTTAGVALNANNIAQALSHANLYVVTAVPEPATYALFVAGLIGIGAAANRRRSR